MISKGCLSNIGSEIFLHLLKKNLLGVQSIYNVVLISGLQQSDSVTHIYISIIFQILFSYKLSQTMSKVPCISQYVFVDYLSYIW